MLHFDSVKQIDQLLCHGKTPTPTLIYKISQAEEFDDPRLIRLLCHHDYMFLQKRNANRSAQWLVILRML